MSDNKLPYSYHEWQSDDDLNGFKNSFVFDTKNLVSRGCQLIASGIFRDSSNVFFYSAVLEMLVITRNLSFKYQKLNAQTDEHDELFKKILNFRNRLCHTESDENADGKTIRKITYFPLNYDKTSPWLYVKDGKVIVEDGYQEQADDIYFMAGDMDLWINKELIKAFEINADYFKTKLPSPFY